MFIPDMKKTGLLECLRRHFKRLLNWHQQKFRIGLVQRPFLSYSLLCREVERKFPKQHHFVRTFSCPEKVAASCEYKLGNCNDGQFNFPPTTKSKALFPHKSFYSIVGWSSPQSRNCVLARRYAGWNARITSLSLQLLFAPLLQRALF